MPIAHVNRIVFVNLHSVSQFVTTRQPFADWLGIYSFIIHKFRTFLLGREIADSHRLTDRAVFIP